MLRFSTISALLAISAVLLLRAMPLPAQDEKPPRPARGAKPAPTARAKAAPVVPGRGVRTAEAERDKLLEQITKITAASGANVQAVPCQHVTLWAAKDLQPVFLADVRKLEKFLQTNFKEPIRSGLDKRSAHLVLVKTRYDYERWIRAMFDVMGDPTPPGQQDGNFDLKASILKRTGYIPPNFGVFCLENEPADWAHRVLALGMGYMYFVQLTESQENEPLATGFANGLESVLMGTPRVMLFSNSYQNEDRDLGKDPRAWSHLVQQRIAMRQASRAGQLLKMDTYNMLLPQYAEAWTFVGALARQPDKFCELLLALREEKDALAAIERIYGWDEKKLTEQWHKQVRAQR